MIWYIEDAGKAKKIPEEVLKYKIENYEVSGDKLVVNEEIKNWVPLRETQIWKEHRKDAEKDGGSNFEKESRQSHTWRCEKCGNIISEIPCKYCSSPSSEQGKANFNSTTENIQRRNGRIRLTKAECVSRVLIIIFVLVTLTFSINFILGDRVYVAKFPEYNAATVKVDGYLHRDKSCCQKVADLFDAEVISVRTKENAGTNEFGQTVTYSKAFSPCPLCYYD